MKLWKLAGATSEIWQIFIADSSSATGAGLTGLVFNSAGLTAYYHRDTDTTATAIALVTMTVGTFTSSGFKEIDATNMPGFYQFCPPNAALAAAAKSCALLLKGATNMAPLPIEVQLTAVNLDSAATFMTGVNGLAPPTNWNLESIDASGRVDVGKVAGTAQTARDIGATLGAAGAGLTAIPTVATVTTVTNQLTAAQIATGVWQDATAGDFTTASSIGKSLYTTGNAPGAASGIALVGSNVGAATSVSGAVGSVTGAVGSVTARVTANTDQLNGQAVTAAAGVTFPASVASPTNITAGTITTVTNLTNAPTAGDLTATMKTSVTTAATAATPTAAAVTGAVGSVTGNVGGNVVGSVASVTAAVTVTGTPDVNVKTINSTTVKGTGVAADLWRA